MTREGLEDHASICLAQREIAQRRRIGYGDPAMPPERHVAYYVLGELQAWVPMQPHPSHREPPQVPAVPPLTADGPTGRLLTEEGVERMEGTGRQWCVYKSIQRINWAGCDLQGDTMEGRLARAAVQQHHAVELSQHDYALLCARHGKDAFWPVAPPVWGR
jgi:hypothetical protein